jgi:tungstate transport system ATP-binding protein
VSLRGVKVVMTTHDLGEAARLAGEIVLLHRGAVIESGSADVMLARPRTEDARRFIAGQLLL